MKFKVGDRVNVYGRPSPGIGVGAWTGQVVEQAPGPHEGGTISVRAEYNRQIFDVHPKQCRRLKPKAKPLVVQYETEVGPSMRFDQGMFSPPAKVELAPLIGKRVRVRVEEIK